MLFFIDPPVSVCDAALTGGSAVAGRDAAASSVVAANSEAAAEVPRSVPCGAVLGLCSAVSVFRYGPFGGCVEGWCCWNRAGLMASKKDPSTVRRILTERAITFPGAPPCRSGFARTAS